MYDKVYFCDGRRGQQRRQRDHDGQPGRLLRNRGFRVTLQKLDPYLNVDAGTMNPYQHGEVFVTEDGAETDLDLGHYERFVDIELTRLASVTTGSVYRTVIAKERLGDYLGATVQMIPQFSGEIKERVRAAAKGEDGEPDRDVVIAEVGGTVGDIEGQIFLEAIRQFRKDVGSENVMYIHVTLIPSVGPWSEVKTKPTQHSVNELRRIGIQPDVLICRTKVPLSQEIKNKISLFCDVDASAVIEMQDVETIYEVPLTFEEAGLAALVLRRLNLPAQEPDLAEWRQIVERIKRPTHVVEVAVVGKYVDNGDAYISIGEALRHGGIANDARVNLHWIDSEELEESTAAETLGEVDAILVAPGFGGARGGRQDRCGQLRANPQYPLSWHLLRDADGGHRVWTLRGEPGRCPYGRGCAQYPTSTDSHFAGTERYCGQGRQYAAGNLQVPVGGRLPGGKTIRSHLDQRASSTSVRSQ